MVLAVADTSPIRYLAQIDRIDLLPHLFGKVFIPSVVADELRHPSAPRAAVQAWMTELPGWAEVSQAMDTGDPALRRLDPGERSAIILGLSLKADLILMDDSKGVAAALQKGLEVTGTLGVLDRAAQRGLIDLADALARLKQTNFRYRQEMVDVLLDRHKGKSQ